VIECLFEYHESYAVLAASATACLLQRDPVTDLVEHLFYSEHLRETGAKRCRL